MQVKFRLSDDSWNNFINKTNTPSEVLRELVNNYLDDSFPLNQTIGTSEAADILGLSQDHVKLLCRQGKIKSKRIGKTWIIDKNSLKLSE